MRRLLGRIGDYARHDDPRAAAANLVALVVAGNQPFYPLYVYYGVSHTIWPVFLTFLSTPFFLAVPAVARKSSIAGRAMLPLVGMANTVLSAKAFGVASGVELFLAPCLMLAGMLFGLGERWLMLALVVLAGLIFLVLHDRYGMPLHLYGPVEYRSFFRLNALSVITLMGFLGLTLAGLISRLSETGKPLSRRDGRGNGA